MKVKPRAGSLEQIVTRVQLLLLPITTKIPPGRFSAQLVRINVVELMMRHLSAPSRSRALWFCGASSTSFLPRETTAS